MRYQEQELADSWRHTSVIRIGQGELPDADVSFRSCLRHYPGQVSTKTKEKNELTGSTFAEVYALTPYLSAEDADGRQLLTQAWATAFG